MAVYVFFKLFFIFTTWTLFIICNYIYNVIRALYWRMNGVHRQLVANKKPENYKTSAHVKKIIFCYVLEGFIRNPESFFLTIHERFVNPEFVLSDDCTLYAVTPNEVIFLQTKIHPNDVFKTDFFRDGQPLSAGKLITIPINQFNKLAEEMEDDGAKIIFLHNQARCGGTLFTALFKETGRCVCFNEPICLSSVCRLLFTDYVWHAATARRILRNTVRMLCKPYRSLEEKTIAYVIKPVFIDIVCVEMIQEVFPDAIQFYIYRNPMEVCVSMRRAGEALAILKFLFHMPNIPNLPAFIGRMTGYHHRESLNWSCSAHPEFVFGYRSACITIYFYLEALKHGVNVHGLKYDDLIGHPDTMIRKIFKISKLPDSLVEKAKGAMTKDSQENSVVSREHLNRVMPSIPKLPAEFQSVALELSEEFDVPSPELWQDKTFRLHNSLEP